MFQSYGAVEEKDAINTIDKNGLKQGHWIYSSEGKGLAFKKDMEPGAAKPIHGINYYKHYNKKGQRLKDGEFENHKLMTGKCYQYSLDGILQRIDVYNKGEYIGKPFMK